MSTADDPLDEIRRLTGTARPDQTSTNKTRRPSAPEAARSSSIKTVLDQATRGSVNRSYGVERESRPPDSPAADIKTLLRHQDGRQSRAAHEVVSDISTGARADPTKDLKRLLRNDGLDQAGRHGDRTKRNATADSRGETISELSEVRLDPQRAPASSPGPLSEWPSLRTLLVGVVGIALLAGAGFAGLQRLFVEHYPTPLAAETMAMVDAVEAYAHEHAALPDRLSQLDSFPKNAVEWPISRYGARLMGTETEYFYDPYIGAGYVILVRKGDEAWAYTSGRKPPLTPIPAH